MTKIIPKHEIISIGGIENAVHFSKERLNDGDLLIAQNEKEEDWYNVQLRIDLSVLKTGYTMYILTKHQK